MRLNNPKPNTCFTKHHGRLALFHAQDNHKDYWKEYWTEDFFKKLIGNVQKGKLSEFELYGLDFLKKTDRILEAGCGPAHIVLALDLLGYTQVSGIDYEEQVIENVNKFLPDLNVKVGNIFRVDLPSEFLDAYLSFGVVEHFEEGPEQAIIEANRILKQNGIAMISVPYLNPLRRSFLKKFNSPPEEGLHFHQYYFAQEDFTLLLKDKGFEVIKLFPYGCEAFFIREHSLFSKLWKSVLMRETLKSVFRQKFYYAPNFVRHRYGHMCMFICRKIR